MDSRYDGLRCRSNLSNAVQRRVQKRGGKRAPTAMKVRGSDNHLLALTSCRAGIPITSLPTSTHPPTRSTSHQYHVFTCQFLALATHKTGEKLGPSLIAKVPLLALYILENETETGLGDMQ